MCNAGHVKNVPGRKTDLLDAEWLVHLLECGLLRGWFIPPADIKAARDVIRYRRKLVEHRSSKLQRLGNVLQDAGIKADSVASSVTTKSVRAMVEALIDGERRPAVLADLARGSMRSKIPDLQRALEGRFDDPTDPASLQSPAGHACRGHLNSRTSPQIRPVSGAFATAHRLLWNTNQRISIGQLSTLVVNTSRPRIQSAYQLVGGQAPGGRWVFS